MCFRSLRGQQLMLCEQGPKVTSAHLQGGTLTPISLQARESSFTLLTNSPLSGSRRFRSIQNGTEPLDLVSSHGSVKFLQQPAGQDSGHQGELPHH